MKFSDRKQIALLLETMEETRYAIDKDKANGMVTYLKKVLNETSDLDVSLLKNLRNEAIVCQESLGEELILPILSAIDDAIEKILYPLGKHEAIFGGIDFGSTDLRRMPIYLLLDDTLENSESGLMEVNQGIQILHNELMGQPQAVEMVWISAISLGTSASILAPLQSIIDFTPPQLSLNEHASFGAALRRLSLCLDREVQLTTATKKGDYKPLVFLLSPGSFRDKWEPEFNSLQARRERKVGSIVVLACGENPQIDIMRQISNNVLLIRDVTPDNIRAFFKWVSTSVSTTNSNYSTNGGASLPPPPTGFQVVL